MQLTPTITFRGVERTDALEAEVITRLRKLETYYQGTMGCRVLVELLQRHHEAGNRYHVRIDLTVPGKETSWHTKPACVRPPRMWVRRRSRGWRSPIQNGSTRV